MFAMHGKEYTNGRTMPRVDYYEDKGGENVGRRVYLCESGFRGSIIERTVVTHEKCTLTSSSAQCKFTHKTSAKHTHGERVYVPGAIESVCHVKKVHGILPSWSTYDCSARNYADKKIDHDS